MFCASLADCVRQRCGPSVARRPWHLIRETPNLDWLLLTKRIGNVNKSEELPIGLDGFVQPAKEGRSITGKTLVLEGAAPFTSHPEWHAFPENQQLARIGKKAAGRELDGRIWDETRSHLNAEA